MCGQGDRGRGIAAYWFKNKTAIRFACLQQLRFDDLGMASVAYD